MKSDKARSATLRQARMMEALGISVPGTPWPTIREACRLISKALAARGIGVTSGRGRRFRYGIR